MRHYKTLIYYYYFDVLLIAAVINQWLFGQTALTSVSIVVLTARVRASPDCRFSAQCKVIALPAFYDAITGPTEFIISIVNSGKMVNMP